LGGRSTIACKYRRRRIGARNGLRRRDFDTRVGTIDLAIPKLRSDSYYPGWLLEEVAGTGAPMSGWTATT
jgi:transposase-like protein